MKKIAIVNAHWNNRGDEAALRAVIDCIINNCPESAITIIFKDKGQIKQFPYEGRVKYITTRFLIEEEDFLSILAGRESSEELTGVWETMDVVQAADYVIYSPGGAVISDRFWWRKQLEYLFPIAYAEKLGKPVFFAAPSIGPFMEKYKIRTDVLKNVERLCVREEISQRELVNQDVIDNVVVTIDNAFLNSIGTSEKSDILRNDIELASFMNKYKKVIGITITDLSWNVKYSNNKDLVDSIFSTFTNFIAKMETYNIGVLLIPQLFGEQNDSDALKKFERKNTFLLSEDYDAFEQQYIISKLYCVIGMRYHSNIFAAKASIPFIPIIYEEKMSGFLEKYGLLDYAIDVCELSYDKLLDIYLKLSSNYKLVSNILESYLGIWKKKAQKTERLLLNFLDMDR